MAAFVKVGTVMKLYVSPVVLSVMNPSCRTTHVQAVERIRAERLSRPRKKNKRSQRFPEVDSRRLFFSQSADRTVRFETNWG